MKLTKSEVATTAQVWDQLPTIDLSRWSEGTSFERQKIAETLFEAATTSGFFYLKGHGIAPEVIANAYKASENFHNSPVAYKSRYDIAQSKIHRGWASVEQTSGFLQDGVLVNNYYEAFDLSFDVPETDAAASQGYGLVGPNPWPDLPKFQDHISHYYNCVYQLGRQLLGVIEVSLDLPGGTLLDLVNKPTSQLRLLKYFANDAPADELNAGISAHSDYECFTILHTSGPGLQVLSYDGHWVDAPPIEGAYLVNVGDCLEALTGGTFKATQHRVINLGKERYSMPFFFAVDYDTTVRPLPRFATSETNKRYPEFQAGEHLWARTIQTFPYLKKLYDEGQLPVSFTVAEQNPFYRISEEERELLDSK